MRKTSTRQLKQAGAAALTVTMLLLFVSTIAVFYLNRGLIFDQKSSANQARSVSAFEVAEAGIEWATGMFNTAFDIDANCNFLTTTNISFRRKYMQPNFLVSSDATPVTNVYPGCKINGTALTCSCPAAPASTATATAVLGTSTLPNFTVAFSAVPLDPNNPTGPKDAEAIRVTSTGCTAVSAACAPGTATGSSGPDAVASVSVILKLRSVLRAAPPASLTCANNCSPGGSFNIINKDVNTNGILINAGGTITESPGVTYDTLPGIPPKNALVDGDLSLSSLYTGDTTCTNSAIFKTYFGSTIQQYREVSTTKTIPGCNVANTCGSLVNAAYNDGWRSFYFPDGFALNSSAPFTSLGSTADPVTIVTPGGFDVNGTIDIYGLVFSNSASVNDFGTGSANIHGGVVVCGNLSSNGNGTVEYDGNALRNSRRSTALLVRVIGSWSDTCKLVAGNPPTLTCN